MLRDLAGEEHAHARATLPRTDAGEQTCTRKRKSCRESCISRKAKESLRRVAVHEPVHAVLQLVMGLGCLGVAIAPRLGGAEVLQRPATSRNLQCMRVRRAGQPAVRKDAVQKARGVAVAAWDAEATVLCLAFSPVDHFSAGCASP
jgi:hypothetical protein